MTIVKSRFFILILLFFSQFELYSNSLEKNIPYVDSQSYFTLERLSKRNLIENDYILKYNLIGESFVWCNARSPSVNFNYF